MRQGRNSIQGFETRGAGLWETVLRGATRGSAVFAHVPLWLEELAELGGCLFRCGEGCGESAEVASRKGACAVSGKRYFLESFGAAVAW